MLRWFMNARVKPGDSDSLIAETGRLFAQIRDELLHPGEKAFALRVSFAFLAFALELGS